jgi:hypothetical protein
VAVAVTVVLVLHGPALVQRRAMTLLTSQQAADRLDMEVALMADPAIAREVLATERGLAKLSGRSLVALSIAMDREIRRRTAQPVRIGNR